MRTYNGDNGNNNQTATITDNWWPIPNEWESWKMYGKGGNDTLTGGPKNDTLYGDEGNDSLKGGGGDDYLYGGSEHDTIDGGTGNDVLYGESGNDVLYGWSGNDYLSGGTGNDRLDGYATSGTEYDTLLGGIGADTFDLGGSSWGVSYLGSGYATITDFYWGEGDKFEVMGSFNNYSLGYSQNFSGSSILDTGIYYNGDLIAVVQDTTDVILSTDSNISDFLFV
jgi:Ca2+-binding RTX toxin-like protein